MALVAAVPEQIAVVLVAVEPGQVAVVLVAVVPEHVDRVAEVQEVYNRARLKLCGDAVGLNRSVELRLRTAE